jgi:hypothetical protein
MQDIINLTHPYLSGIINTSVSLDLSEVLATLNKHNHNGFDCWIYNPDLDIIVVSKPMNVAYIYYYALTIKQAELIAKNYRDNEQ